MLSSVRCETVCRKGNDGVVNGVVIPAMLDPDKRVARPRDCLVGHAPDDAKPRTEVESVELTGGPRLAILAEVLELLRLQVEHGRLVVLLGRGEVQRVAKRRRSP